jgi:hypothetical protein
MLKSGKIKKFTSFARALIFFILKKNGKLRLYVDYKGLNKVMVKNCYIFFLILEMLNRIVYAKVFFKINLKDVYYKL